MRTIVVGYLVFLGLTGPAWAQLAAERAYDPPTPSKDALDAALHPIPQATVAEYLSYVSAPYVFRQFEGRNEALKAANDGSKILMVGENAPLNLGSPALFTDAAVDGAHHVFLGSIASVDAYALRVRADLSALGDGEEIWVIDPTEPRAFGPFTRNDHAEGGRWLSVIAGDTAVVMARSGTPDLPQVRVTGLSHFYRDLESVLKALSCNINIACETNAALRDQISTAVGRLAITLTNGTGLCSGTLINNADTPALEPYLITANHCISTVPEAVGTEVFWDYRAANCDGSNVPTLGSLPRSNGNALLATNSTLDGTLIRLGTVPSGSLGRTYLGWDRRAPVINENIIGIHHPGGTPMRISHGRVLAINRQALTYEKQTRVVWDEGVTEGGSSGSCLLFNNGSFPLVGMLSNGASHTCGADRSGNTDHYVSFRDFFSIIEGFLTGTSPPPPIDGDTGGCPAKTVFQDNPEALKKLREFRDKGLLPTALGRQLAAAYYKAAPYLADLVRRSPQVRDAFILTAAPFIQLGDAYLAQGPDASLR